MRSVHAVACPYPQADCDPVAGRARGVSVTRSKQWLKAPQQRRISTDRWWGNYEGAFVHNKPISQRNTGEDSRGETHYRNTQTCKELPRYTYRYPVRNMVKVLGSSSSFSLSVHQGRRSRSGAILRSARASALPRGTAPRNHNTPTVPGFTSHLTANTASFTVYKPHPSHLNHLSVPTTFLIV